MTSFDDGKLKLGLRAKLATVIAQRDAADKEIAERIEEILGLLDPHADGVAGDVRRKRDLRAGEDKRWQGKAYRNYLLGLLTGLLIAVAIGAVGQAWRAGWFG